MKDNKELCIDCMDLSCDWSSWRRMLKDNLTEGKRFYWQDEAVQNIAAHLNSLLDEKVCLGTPQEDFIKQMWDISTVDERRTLATVLLRLIGKQ